MKHELVDYVKSVSAGREWYVAICSCGRRGKTKSDPSASAVGIFIHATAANKREARAEAYRGSLRPGPHIEEHW